MIVAVDTNVLVRSVVRDDAAQAEIADHILRTAPLAVIGIMALCELVWVLRTGYRRPAPEITEALERLLSADNVVTNRPAAEAGLAQLKAGGDFADGVIAYEGRWLGAQRFVSFDRKAVTLLTAQGHPAQLLA